MARNTASRRHSTCHAKLFLADAGLDLAQAAALAEHQVGQAALLALREAGRVDVAEQVGAVAVVVVVRHHHADLVQRAGPAELAPRLVASAPRLRRGRSSASATVRTRCGLLRRRRSKRRCSSRTDASRMSCPPASRAAAWQALVEVEDHALAQRAARRLQLVDAEVRRQRVEDRQAAGDHRAAVVLQARQRQALDAAGLAGSCSISQRKPAGVMRPSVTPLGGEQLRHRADRARRAERLAASAAPRTARSASSSSAPAATCAARNAALGEAAVGEVPHRQADAADLERFGAQRLRPRPRIISVERPPMSTTSRGTSDGCSRATPA